MVPFCRRTCADDGQTNEHICGKHFRVTNKTLRRRYRRLKTRLEPVFKAPMPDRRSKTYADATKGWQQLTTMWIELKKQAIEKAMGI